MPHRRSCLEMAELQRIDERLFPFATARVIRGGPNKGSKQMPLYSAIRADCALVGRSPWTARDAPVPLPEAEAGASARARAPAPPDFAGGIWLSQGDTPLTAKNFPSIGPILKKRSSPPRGVGTVSRGRPSNKLKATRRKSIPRSASTHSRFGSSQLNSTLYYTHNCTHS